MVVSVLLLLPLVFYLSNSKASRDHNGFDRAVVYLSSPVQWLTCAVLGSIADAWHHYVDLTHLQVDSDALRAEAAVLREQLAAGEEIRHENERLRLLVGLRERSPEVKSVAAQVVAVAPTPLFRSLRIDRGSRDGVEVGAAVVVHDGVVGRVAAVADAYADVMLLVDANSSTDVLVQRTRARARVRGGGSDEALGIEVQFLGRTADVEPGDTLITSGLGKTFPKGLRVGRLTGVERRAFGLYQRAVVRPSVDYARLETVLVILRGYRDDTSFEAAGGPDAATAPMLEAPLPPPPPPAAEPLPGGRPEPRE